MECHATTEVAGQEGEIENGTDQEFEWGAARADARTRTGDPFITSEVLYQLSYVGEALTVAALRRNSRPAEACGLLPLQTILALMPERRTCNGSAVESRELSSSRALAFLRLVTGFRHPKGMLHHAASPDGNHRRWLRSRLLESGILPAIFAAAEACGIVLSEE